MAVIAAYWWRGFFASRRPEENPRSLFLNHCAWALVAAGAAGNLTDRLAFGYVVDFLDFRIWPVFNIADAGICAGVLLVILNFSRHRGPGRVR
ncbi:MAG: signal peptidase II [Candidatus Omnitrophica bacterium]|nr:signal peptidase II [Candidatus Omnitrophota bacterium]